MRGVQERKGNQKVNFKLQGNITTVKGGKQNNPV